MKGHPREAKASEAVIRFRVHVQPGASRNEVAGCHGDALKVRIQAKAQGGEANRALLRFLANLLDLPPSKLEIVSGTHARNKLVAASTPDPDHLRQLLHRLAHRT